MHLAVRTHAVQFIHKLSHRPVNWRRLWNVRHCLCITHPFNGDGNVEHFIMTLHTIAYIRIINFLDVVHRENFSLMLNIFLTVTHHIFPLIWLWHLLKNYTFTMLTLNLITQKHLCQYQKPPDLGGFCVHALLFANLFEVDRCASFF